MAATPQAAAGRARTPVAREDAAFPWSIGAALGAALAGLLGALTGLGVSDEDARFYDEEFRAGRPVMTVNAADRYDEAREVFRRHGGYDYESRGGVAETLMRHENVKDRDEEMPTPRRTEATEYRP